MIRRPRVITPFPYSTVSGPPPPGGLTVRPAAARRSGRAAPLTIVTACGKRASHAQAGPRRAVPHPPDGGHARCRARSEEHTSELQSRQYIVCRLLLEKKHTT